ncbi:MAG TPA: DUF1616 domain-containing protein [Thermoplasmata archaeon]|nr:DUF1616 domain-containing protein [Thermoplasmata archaeon]
MAVVAAFEAVAGGALVFFVPGYAVTKALFPDWRVRGAERSLRLLEIVTLSFVLSVVLTVLLGYLLLVAAPAGFQSYWSDPALEVGLAVVAATGLVAAVARGAFQRVPPAPRAPEPSGGEEGAWELSRELERLAREERRLEHALRVHGAADAAELRARLDEIRAQRDSLAASREAEYAR